MKGKWCRRILAGVLAATLCCGMFAGCGGNAQTNRQLNLYLVKTATGSLQFADAVEQYKTEHPEVEVCITEFESGYYYSEEYSKQLSNDLIVGKGPDVIVLYSDTYGQLTDIYKQMKAGAFADLTPFLEADESYHADEYNQTVIQSVQMEDKQYIFPVAYNIPLLLTTEELQQQYDFSVEQYGTLNAFMDGMYAASEAGDIDLFTRGGVWKDSMPYLTAKPIVDWQNEKADLQQDAFKAVCSFYQQLYAQEQRAFEGNFTYLSQQLAEENALVSLMCGSSTISRGCLGQYLMSASALAAVKTPVCGVLRDENGGIPALIDVSLAINQASPNQQNAYDFIRILTGSAYQSRASSLPWMGSIPTNTVYCGSKLEKLKQEIKDGNQMAPDSYGLLSEEFLAQYEAILNQPVSTVYLTNSSVSTVLTQHLDDYAKGEIPLEQYLSDCEKRLAIYITE